MMTMEPFLKTVSVVLPMLLAGAVYGDIHSDLLGAAQEGKTGKVRRLLRKGADVNARDDSGMTALFAALDRGKTGTALVLIDAGADVNAVVKGRSVLGFATYKGMFETVVALIDAGADVNAEEHGGTSVLMLAAGGEARRDSRKTEIVKHVIRAGADVDATDEGGMTALMCATAFAVPASVRSMIDLVTKASADVTFVPGGTNEAVNVLIEAGADVNAKTEQGWSALMLATLWRNPGTVKALLDAGADVSAKTRTGMTALKLTESNGHTEIVRLLEQAIEGNK